MFPSHISSELTETHSEVFIYNTIDKDVKQRFKEEKNFIFFQHP